MKTEDKNLMFFQWVASIDLAENAEASANIVVKMSDSFIEQADQVTSFYLKPFWRVPLEQLKWIKD